jgi:hypothetical protein
MIADSTAVALRRSSSAPNEAEVIVPLMTVIDDYK